MAHLIEEDRNRSERIRARISRFAVLRKAWKSITKFCRHIQYQKTEGILSLPPRETGNSHPPKTDRAPSGSGRG